MLDRQFFRRLNHTELGVAFIGTSALLCRIACIRQGDFTAFRQPVPEHLSFETPLSCISAGLLVACGIGLLLTGGKQALIRVPAGQFGVHVLGYARKLFGSPLDATCLIGVLPVHSPRRQAGQPRREEA